MAETRRNQTTSAVPDAVNPNLIVRSKVWLEADGQVVISTWRIELLEAIAQTGSLSEGALRLGVPYRTAWYKLRDAERALGFPLLVRQSGGRAGGGSHLTPAALDLIRRFRTITADVDSLVARRFATAFPTHFATSSQGRMMR